MSDPKATQLLYDATHGEWIDPRIADAAFVARRDGYTRLCLRCLHGFDELECPHCLTALNLAGIRAEAVKQLASADPRYFEPKLVLALVDALEAARVARAGALQEFAKRREAFHRTYNGGWHDSADALRAFHHGMDTVFNALERDGS